MLQEVTFIGEVRDDLFSWVVVELQLIKYSAGCGFFCQPVLRTG